MVTEAQIETFWRDGVVCLRGVLPREVLEGMARTVDAVIASAQSADLSAIAGAPGSSPRFVAGVDHWRHLPEARAFAFDTPLPATVAALLRSNAVYLYEDSVLVKEPGAAERTQWHQDLGYFHVEGTQLCTTWCPLDPADENTGAMSSGVAKRPIGVRASSGAVSCSYGIIGLVMFVSTTPGATAFTRMPCLAHPTASVFVSCTTPALAAP